MAIETHATRVPPKEKLSFEEFHDWCDEDTWAEWVDGKVIMVSPAASRHQEISKFLIKVLDIYIEARDLGSLFQAPFLMRLPERPSGREPDLIFIARERLHLLKNTYLDGPSDLVIEVVSPESVGRDRGEKFVEYERAGIKEYWLIDPDRQSAEFYELSADGRYRLGATEGGVYRSQIVPGFWLRVEWLWQTPPPKALSVLRELKII